MKRKYLSALLMGTLTMASVSTFTSCKDYDDDISNLQGQIDKLASADQLSQKVAELQALISSNSSSISTLQSKLEEAKKAAEKAQTTADSKATLDQVKDILADYAKVSYVDDAKKSLNDAIEALKTGDIAKLKEDVKAAQAAAEKAKADAETAINEVKTDLADNYVKNATYASEKEAAQAALKTLTDKIKANADAIVELKAVDVVTKADLVAKLGEYATKQQATELQEQLTNLKNNFADEIAKYALKSDLNSLATKDELKKASDAAAAALQTKLNDYLKADVLASLATKDDIKDLQNKEAVQNLIKDAIQALKDGDIKAIGDKANEALQKANKAESTEGLAYVKALAAEGKALEAATAAATADAKAETNKTAIATINGLLGDKFDAKNTVSAAIELINTQLTNDKTGLTALDGRLSSIESLLNQDTPDATSLKTRVDNIENDLKKIIGEYTTMVTGVELVSSYSGAGDFGHDLSYYGESINIDMIHGLVAETSVFGDEVSDKIENPVTYEKGQDVKDDNSIIVRINPVNAELTKNTKIVLLNSKGESLEDYVTVGEPTKFTDLIVSRAATVNSGLWKLPVHVAKGVSNEEFKKATQVDGKTILYAVAVKNTETQKDAQDRYVVSTYDVKPSYEDFVAQKNFTFNVDEKSVDGIHNRWTGSEILGENGADHSSSNPELAWNTNGPATAPVLEGDKKNVKNDDRDARYVKSLHQVEVGKKFTISDVKAGNTNAADYYYVVLDKKNAIESGVSELNAWNSYEIDGLKKIVKAGDKLDLTIKSESANGDIIGFRVYAVNRDGKLLDPDGKAFYVVVGDAITGNIVGNLDAYKGQTDKKEFKAVAGVNYSGWQIDTEASKDALPFLNNGKVPTFSPVYYKKDGKTTTSDLSEAAYIAFNVKNPQYIKDDATVVLKNVAYKYNNNNRYEVGTVRASYTKVLPAAFPSDITFRPKQETTDGSGNFKAYMKPVSDYIVAAAAKTEGTVDLDNIFYNLDTKVSFTVKDAAKVADKIVDVTSDPDHVLTINKDFIDSKTAHAITASYNFGEISCQYNAETNAWETKNWIKTSEKNMNVTFACWESVNTYAWLKATSEVKDGNVVIFARNATQPQLKWTAAGTTATVPGQYIKTTNSYNNDFFGGKLDAVIGTKKFLKVVENSANLYYGAQENPYFKVTVDASGNFKFTQNNVQAENAPVADHVETLKFKVRDAFWHEREISLDVKILRPAAAARRK